jgi:hypothetical protein
LQKFYFISFPEQIFNHKRSVKDGIPVLTFFDHKDLNRIIAAVKRWEWKTAVFYKRTDYPLRQFLACAEVFDSIFVNDAEVAKALRETEYEGPIFLFSNFRMLGHDGFYKEFDLRPVVSGKRNFEKAVESSLDPVYILSDKVCVSDLGLCISRKGESQCFYDCDNRCREKSTIKQGLSFPLSIKPELIGPEKGDVLIYSENPVFPKITTGQLREQVLERNWNYRYPVGKNILKPGKTDNGSVFSFPVDKQILELYDKRSLDFYGYSGSFYKGKYVEPLSVKVHGKTKIVVSLKHGFKSLLMIERYSEEEKDFLKKARHFIYTLPEKKILDNPVEDVDREQQKAPQKRSGTGRFSSRVKMTLLSDSSKKFKAFKGRFVEREVLVYAPKKIPPRFPGYIYVAGNISEDDLEEISQMKTLKGVVVPDGIMKEAFSRLFPEKDIFLHPAAYSDHRLAPSLLAASTTVMTSTYLSDKRNNYSWRDINITVKNYSGHTNFITRKRILKNGGKKELWVDLTDINEAALKYLKSQAEETIRKMK